MPSILPPHVADGAFGGTLLGVIMASALWGMACIQAYSYYTNCSKDHPLLKYTMAFLMILNTLHTILISYMVYYYLISQYGDPADAVHIVWSEPAANIVTEIINFIIRILYARRIWLLSNGNKWIVAAIMCFSIPTMAFSFAISAFLYHLPDVTKIPTGGGIYSNFRWVIHAAFAFSTLSEISITGAMFYYLRKLRTHFHKTRSLVQVLIKYAITTGLLAIIVPVASQIAFYINPLTTWGAMLYYLEAHLYMNSFLAVLNARDMFQSDGGHISMGASVFATTDRATESSVQCHNAVQDGIVVLQEIDTFGDGTEKVNAAKAKI